MYLILRSDLNSDTTFPLEILYLYLIIVVQSLSRVQLCHFLNYSTPHFPILYYLPEFPQTLVH